MTTGEPIALSRLKVPKASDLLANELRERILSGDYAEGAGLPSERDLVVQTGLSRTTVREALRILEVQDLIRIRSGRTGGAFVQRPGEETMSKTVEHIIRGHQIQLSALLQTREALEPYCAELAARKRTAEHLIALNAAQEAFIAAVGDTDRMLEANLDWHVAVARASCNELLSGVMSALERAVYDAAGDDDVIDEELGDQAIAAHAAIVDAIRARRPKIAADLMRDHVKLFTRRALHG